MLTVDGQRDRCSWADYDALLLLLLWMRMRMWMMGVLALVEGHARIVFNY